MAPTPTPVPTATRIVRLGGNLNFGSVQVGIVRSDGILTINNDGNAALTVTGLTLPSSTAYTPTWTSGTIAAGGSQIVGVKFAPASAQSYSGLISVLGNQTAGASTIAVTGVGVAAPTPTPGPFSPSLTGTWRGTLQVDTVVYLTQSGSSLSGRYTAVGLSGDVSGSVTSAGHVVFTVSVPCCAPFTFEGDADAAANALTGRVNGSGFFNTSWIIKRQ